MSRRICGVTLEERDRELSPQEKMRRATEMVLDDEYYAQKERIRADMRNSLDALEALTRNAESVALSRLRSDLNSVRVIIALQILGTLLFIWLTIRLGINPLLRAVERIRSDRPIEETGANEFRYLARTYNRLTVQLKRGKRAAEGRLPDGRPDGDPEQNGLRKRL